MKKIFLNEAEKQNIIAEREKAIMESFAKTYNKIKRVDESNLEASLEKSIMKGMKTSVKEMDGYEQMFIPEEIFELEQFEMGSYNIVEFNHGYDDSELEIEYTYTETDSSCFYLKALVTFYFKITGSYRSASWGYYGGSPEEYPEEDFAPEKILEIKYIDCNSGKEYKLTDEMKKIAIPHVFKTVENLQNNISKELFKRLEGDGPDGD